MEDKAPTKKTMQQLAAERPEHRGLRMLAEAEAIFERNRGFGVFDHMTEPKSDPAAKAEKLPPVPPMRLPPGKEGWYNNAFRTKQESDEFSQRLTQELVDNLNRHLTSDEFLRNHYRYQNPRSSAADIELLVAADHAAGHPAKNLTLEDARRVLGLG